MQARHRLFFALRPPVALVPAIAALRDRDGTGHGRVEDHRLHLTTLLFADHAELPPGLVERACGAVGNELRAFRIVLDRLIGDDRGVRLVPGEPNRSYDTFQRNLADAIGRAGLTPRSGWSFSPHMTLRYGGRHCIDDSVKAISWRAEELVLIDSVLGAYRHETLARWALR